MKKYAVCIFTILIFAIGTINGCSQFFFSSVTDFDPSVPTRPVTRQQAHSAPVQIALMTGLHAIPNLPASSGAR